MAYAGLVNLQVGLNEPEKVLAADLEVEMGDGAYSDASGLENHVADFLSSLVVHLLAVAADLEDSSCELVQKVAVSWDSWDFRFVCSCLQRSQRLACHQ